MKTSRVRALLLFWLLFFGFVAVVSRGIEFQVHPNPKLVEFAKNKSKWNQRREEESFLKSRGSILDRHGRDWALSLISKSFFANPHLVEHPGLIAYKLSKYLKMSVH